MTKRMTALLLTVWMLLSLCACGAPAGEAPAEEAAEKPAEEAAEEPAAPLSPMEQLVADAEAGDAEAMAKLGRMYHDGDGVEKNYEAARSWYEKAGEAGYGLAYLWLGDTYYFPDGEGGDYGKSFEYYSKAAEAGISDAMGNLGVLYAFGRGVEQDYEKAVQWYEKAADAGCVWAMRNLGDIYLRGRDGIEVDEEKGLDLLKQSADAGFTDGYYTLGSYYHYTKQDFAQAEEYYMKALEAGNSLAYRGLGLLYTYSLNEFDKGEEYLLKAVESGDSSMLTVLGDFYGGVGGMAKFDPEKAVEWYTKATEGDKPSAYALFQLGELFFYGRGGTVDYEKAFDYFNRAIEVWKADNSTESYYVMAVETVRDMYAAGLGTDKDPDKAAEYDRWAEELKAAR